MQRCFHKPGAGLLLALSLVFVHKVYAANVSRGELAPGAPYETEFFTLEGNRPGPTILIVSGVHGDEPAGPVAANQIRHWPIQAGKVVILPIANKLSAEAGSRLLPIPGTTNRCDLNRAFAPSPDPVPTNELAQAIWKFVAELKPNWLLDLHEGVDFRSAPSTSTGNTIIACDDPEARTLGEGMLSLLNRPITTNTQGFVLLKHPVQGSLARAAFDALKVKSFILETTRKSQPVAFRARQHRLAVHHFLAAVGALPADSSPHQITAINPSASATRVAVYDGAGNGGVGVPRVLDELIKTPGFTGVRVCPEDIQAGVLSQFDTVIFTGGSGSGQAKAIGESGRAQVRSFVEKGGGYIGICAGSYLACAGFPWGLGILDARTKSPLWQRGKGMVSLEFTTRGESVFTGPNGRFECLYAQGPILEPCGKEEIPDYEVLSYFRTEVARNNTPVGIMVDSPAIVCGAFGRGKVLCFSPHPEQTPGIEDQVSKAIRWVARK